MALSLSSCKETNVESGSLGLTLPQPEMKSVNPYSQFLEVQGYIRLQGNCDSRLETIQLSVDQSNWLKPPASPTWDNLTINNPITTNDLDCRDGQFDIYLSQIDLDQMWGPNALKSQFDRIYLRGHSANADSVIVTLTKQSTVDFFDPTPTKVRIDPLLAKSFSLIDQCVGHRVYIENSAGNRNVSNASPITFTIENAINQNTNYTLQTLYKTMEDCMKNISASTSLTIPAGVSESLVFQKLTGANSGRINTRVVSMGLQNDNNFVSTELTADDTKRFLKIRNDIQQIIKNTCYPVHIELSELAAPFEARDISNTTLHLSSTSGLLFYSDSNCSNAIAAKQTQSTPTEYSTSFYIKYNPTSQDTAPFKIVDLNIAARASDTGISLPYDFIPAKIKVDLSVKNIATNVKMRGTSYTKTGDCEPYEISARNPNGTLVPVINNELIQLSFPANGIGAFYINDSCTTEVSATTLTTGNSSQKIFVLPTTTTAQNTLLKVVPASLPETSKGINIKTPQNVKIGGLYRGDNSNYVYLTCGLSDSEGRTFKPINPTSVTVGATISGTSVSTYSVNQTPSNICLIQPGKKYGVLMFKKNPAFNESQIFFEANSPDLNGLMGFPLYYDSAPVLNIPN